MNLADKLKKIKTLITEKAYPVRGEQKVEIEAGDVYAIESVAKDLGVNPFIAFSYLNKNEYRQSVEVSTNLMCALAFKSGMIEDYKEILHYKDPKKALCEQVEADLMCIETVIKRKDVKTPIQYTLHRSELTADGVFKKPNWKNSTVKMWRASARRGVMRMAFPDTALFWKIKTDNLKVEEPSVEEELGDLPEPLDKDLKKNIDEEAPQDSTIFDDVNSAVTKKQEEESIKEPKIKETEIKY